MKKNLIKTLALATLALSLVFTVATTTEAANDGIMLLSDLKVTHGVRN